MQKTPYALVKEAIVFERGSYFIVDLHHLSIEDSGVEKKEEPV